ncbi:TEA/ATTS domain family-domain-containing protein [Phaeosphaeria sp. MPI-PUGE-AT-0046c]|nr:TEA/ATTS domain family-domain-containing protein [Phaeosphaeria sp. MPI-PUGE-AT-0046c]
MELQQQRSCVQPDEVPVLDATQLDTTTQQRAILQERSANWLHDFNNQPTSIQKQSRSPSPGGNIYARRAAPAGIYFTGNVHAQHIGLAGFGTERSEKQVEYELNRLYCMLRRSDKYQKYREKQPKLTVNEVLAKEAREAAEKKAREAAGGSNGKDEKDKTVWPEFLEHAFWRALVRWPPMGRKKFMLDGALRGRNELIQDSIRRDTGIVRDRKQVSSHLQVLKQHLHNQPGVLVYMATVEDDKKRSRHRESSHAYHVPQMRHRQQPHRTASASKYDFDTPASHLWGGSDTLPASYSLNSRHGAQNSSTSPYSVTDFTMFVGIDDKPVHYFTQLASDGRQDDFNVTDSESWRKLYPEFDFLRSQMADWTMQDRNVIVCNASIKVMTESRPNASLSITFNLDAQRDLSVFDSVWCTTRFYDSGDMAPDPQFDGRDAQDLKEHRTPCDYRAGPPGRSGCLRIAFGSKFWVNRMTKYQNLRHGDERCVSKSLLRLTATQDIYGIKPVTGEAERVLTILWRFTQTRSSAEVGSMNWRAVNFDIRQTPAINQVWNNDKTDVGMKVEDLQDAHEETLNSVTSGSHEASLYQQVPNLALDYHQQLQHNTYGVPGTHAQHPPQLHLDVLASLQPELEHTHASAAPSASTDYSQQSLPSLSHSRDAVGLYGQDPHDFDFNGGHITISGAFDPTINLHEYDNLANHNTSLDSLHGLVGLDQDGYNLGLACAAGNEIVDVGVSSVLQDNNLACYSTKPNWQHNNLISSLENAAEQYHAYADHSQATHGHDVLPRHHGLAGPSPALTQGEDFAAHGLHDPHMNVNHSLWGLQSPFHEDTAGGASDGNDCRKDSGVHGHGVGLGVLELIERDQRARGY